MFWKKLQGHSQDGVVRFEDLDDWDLNNEIRNQVKMAMSTCSNKVPTVFDHLYDVAV